jgi:hypothetical protein
MPLIYNANNIPFPKYPNKYKVAKHIIKIIMKKNIRATISNFISVSGFVFKFGNHTKVKIVMLPVMLEIMNEFTSKLKVEFRPITKKRNESPLENVNLLDQVISEINKHIKMEFITYLLSPILNKKISLE